MAGPPPSWAAIQTDLEARLAYANLDVLFSDGGPGIEESLRHPGMAHQRCQWHGRRRFPSLLYADGFKKPEQGPLVAQRQAIPALARTRPQLEPLRPEDRPAVEQMLAKTAQGVHGLLPALNPGRYPQARSSIQNLMEPVTTFLRWWRQTGEAIPLTTSAIESAFSQVSNRIKRVGKRWAEQGLLNWLNVTFSTIFTPGRWAHILGQNLQEVPRIRLISIRASSAWSAASGDFTHHDYRDRCIMITRIAHHDRSGATRVIG